MRYRLLKLATAALLLAGCRSKRCMDAVVALEPRMQASCSDARHVMTWQTIGGASWLVCRCEGSAPDASTQ